MSTAMSKFAHDILQHKYAMEKPDGSKETWKEVSQRVATSVVGPYLPALVYDVAKVIEDRKFIPAGRYLYAAGRKLHQVNNCLILDVKDSKEGWAKLLHNVSLGLMTGAGIGVNYSQIRGYGERISGLGGIASGPVALMQMVNEVGRHIMQGGSRRCLPESSLIPTKRGLLRIKNLKIGDLVQTSTGYYPVTNIFEQGVQQVYNIRTEVSNFECTPTHQVAIYLDKDKYGWKQAKDLLPLDRLVFVPKASETDNEEENVLHEEMAWLLGFLQVRAIKPISTFSRNHDLRTEKIKHLVGKYQLEVYNHQIVYQMDDFLRKYMDRYFEYGEVPDFVMTGSQRTRAAFIAGIVDCGGSTSIEPLRILITKNENYAKQVQAVIHSLGILCRLQFIEIHGTYRLTVRRAFRLLLKEAMAEFMATELPLFDRVHKAYRKSLYPIKITSMVPGRMVYTFDIEVDERHEFIADGLLTHNSALLASLHWNHPDVSKFIRAKDWSPELRAQKESDFNFPAPLDGTNISVVLDDEFFAAFNDFTNPNHTLATDVYWNTVRQMCKTGEPGFLVAHGENQGEYLTNAPLSKDTNVLTKGGYKTIGEIIGEEVEVWTGIRWAKTVFEKTGENSRLVEVKISGGRAIKAELTHEFLTLKYPGRLRKNKTAKVVRVQAQHLKPGDYLAVSLPNAEREKFSSKYYTLGFLYGDGSFYPGGKATLSICSPTKHPCMSGFDDSLISGLTSPDNRGYITFRFKDVFLDGRGKDRFENDIPIEVLPSFIAGLFDSDGSYDKKRHLVRLSLSLNLLTQVRRELERLGIVSRIVRAGISTFGKKQTYALTIDSNYVVRFAELIPTKRVIVDREYEPYRLNNLRVLSVTPVDNEDVYCCNVGYDEHSFVAEGVLVANCGEVTSRDNNDVCNLGSLNMARITDKDDMRTTVELGTILLLCGSLYSSLPFPEIGPIRDKNRRLGLGMFGLHEWLLMRRKSYGPDAELAEWLEIYTESDYFARKYSNALGISTPVKTRSIAPAGTISIIGETTSGIEPIFCTAFKRRYLKGTNWYSQYVVDATAQRLIARGVAPETIEDAYSLSGKLETRLDFQAFMQRYVSHSISSTINISPWKSSENNPDTIKTFGKILAAKLPLLRGITVYPDGARGGQPLVPVSYAEAIEKTGTEFEEFGNEHSCVNGVCGI